MAELSYPIVPEVGEDGTKRLYKTRYSELEKMYTNLYKDYDWLRAASTKTSEAYIQARENLSALSYEFERLKERTADSSKLEKRINHLCKEFQIQLPDSQFGERSLEERLDSFFGAILCRMKSIEVEADELAD